MVYGIRSQRVCSVCGSLSCGSFTPKKKNHTHTSMAGAYITVQSHGSCISNRCGTVTTLYVAAVRRGYVFTRRYKSEKMGSLRHMVEHCASVSALRRNTGSDRVSPVTC